MQLYFTMSEAEDDVRSKQLKIVIVGDGSSGKVYFAVAKLSSTELLDNSRMRTQDKTWGGRDCATRVMVRLELIGLLGFRVKVSVPPAPRFVPTPDAYFHSPAEFTTSSECRPLFG